MRISYDSKKDLLYLRLIDDPQDVINKRLSGDVVLDLGTGDTIVGIEILDASTYLDLNALLPIEYDIRS